MSTVVFTYSTVDTRYGDGKVNALNEAGGTQTNDIK